MRGPHIHCKYGDPGGQEQGPQITVNVGTRGPYNWWSSYLLDTGIGEFMDDVRN